MYKGKQNRSSKASLSNLQGGNLQESMQILYAHQKQCQKTGKYLEADMTKKKLTRLKLQLQRQRREEMGIKHGQERSEVEKAHVEEISEFKKYWDEKIIQYQQEAEKLETETLERHQIEENQFEEEIEKCLEHRQKESSQMINLRKIEESLAHQENYIEAHKVQKQIQQLQSSQYEKWSQSRYTKKKNLLTQLRNKQENEINALRQRIEQGFEEQKKIRTQQEDKLIQKYQNFMKQLQFHHHQELIKFDKSVKMQSTINFSRNSNTSRTLREIN